MNKLMCRLVCYSTFEAELSDVIPVIKTSIGGTRIVGRLCIGKEFFLGYLNSVWISYKFSSCSKTMIRWLY